MILATLDEAMLDRNLRTLSDVYGKPLFDVVRNQAGLVARECIKDTPPMTFGREYGQSFAEQRRIGQEAVKRDVGKVFKTADEFSFLGSGDGVDDGNPAHKFSNAIKRLMRKGDVAGAEMLLRRSKIRVRGVVDSASLYLHKQARNRSGRVNSNIRPWLVKNKASIKEVLRARLAMVGTAKSGWFKAAFRLGVKVPSWIIKASGSGSYSEIRGNNPSVYVSNDVPYVAETNMERRIVERAMRNRLRNSTKEVEHALAASLRRKGVQVTVT